MVVVAQTLTISHRVRAMEILSMQMVRCNWVPLFVMFYILIVCFLCLYTDATVKFLVPGAEFQELNPLNADGSCDEPPCQAAALVKGKVLLGLGCYCKDPKKSIDCSKPIRSLRALQDVEDQVLPVDFEAAMEVINDGVNETAGCQAGPVMCFLLSILSIILKLLTFGLLG
jgi:hypothetical protein